MTIDDAEVKKIASLARIELSPTEVGKFQGELGEIIDYNGRKLAQVKKPPQVKVSGSRDFGQADEPRPSLSPDLALSNAQAEENGFFTVPKVLDD